MDAAALELRIRASAERLIEGVSATPEERCDRVRIVSFSPLSGGQLNHVWAARVATSVCFCATAHPPDEPCCCVVKYSPPYIASQPAVPLDSSRLVFESRALALVRDLLPPPPAHDGDMMPCLRVHVAGLSVVLGVPHLLASEAGTPLAVMSMFQGAASISAALQDRSEHAFTPVTAVAHWLGWLHAASFDRFATFAAGMDNAPIQRVRNAVQYHGMAAALAALRCDAAPEQRDAFIDAAGALGDALATPGTGMCLVHGDAWLASFLTRDRGDGLQVCAIDWEMAHAGVPAQDVAHFAAHVAMLLHTGMQLPDTADAGRVWTSCIDAYVGAVQAALQAGHASRFLASLRRSRHARACLLHSACEVLARMHAFRAGYVYEAAPDDALAAIAVRLVAHVMHELRTADALDAEVGRTVAGQCFETDDAALAAYMRASLLACWQHGILVGSV